MSIVQWNIQSYKSNFTELKTIITDKDPTCICLQETRHEDGKIKPPSRYNILESKRNRPDNHYRGVAILIKKTTNYLTIPLNTPLQAVAAKVWMGKWYTICNLYLPHISTTQSEIERLIDQLDTPFLLLGDMNAKSPLWFESDVNERGRIFENLVQRKNLSVLNSNSPTHYHIQTNSSSIIDLSISSPDCILDFTQSVMESLHGSDHYPIMINKLQNDNSAEMLRKFIVEKADWTKFSELTTLLSPPSLDQDIDELIIFLNEAITGAAEASIPMSGNNPRKTPTPWWNDECKLALRERRRAERALKRNYNIPNKIAYQRCKAICRQTFKNAMTESWKKYVSSINSNTSISKSLETCQEDCWEIFCLSQSSPENSLR